MQHTTLQDAGNIQQVPYRLYFNGETLGALAELPGVEFGEKSTAHAVFNADNAIVDLAPDKLQYAEISVKMLDVAKALALISGDKNSRCGKLFLQVVPPARGINLTFPHVDLLPRGNFALNTATMQYIKVIFAAAPEKNSGNLFLCS